MRNALTRRAAYKVHIPWKDIKGETLPSHHPAPSHILFHPTTIVVRTSQHCCATVTASTIVFVVVMGDEGLAVMSGEDRRRDSGGVVGIGLAQITPL
jgi:hypothetical protein